MVSELKEQQSFAALESVENKLHLQVNILMDVILVCTFYFGFSFNLLK